MKFETEKPWVRIQSFCSVDEQARQRIFEMSPVISQRSKMSIEKETFSLRTIQNRRPKHEIWLTIEPISDDERVILFRRPLWILSYNVWLFLFLRLIPKLFIQPISNMILHSVPNFIYVHLPKLVCSQAESFKLIWPWGSEKKKKGFNFFLWGMMNEFKKIFLGAS